MIRSISKTEQLKDWIIDGIRSGQFNPGEPLPSIRNLTVIHDVSKHTVSQAFSMLKELGIIEVSHGKQPMVAPQPFDQTIEILYSGLGFLQTQEFWKEFYYGIKEKIEAQKQYQISVRSFSDIAFSSNSNSAQTAKLAGAIVLGVSEAERMQLLKRWKVPIVSVYEYNSSDDGIPFVSVNYESVMQQFVGKCASAGKTKIAYIGYFNKSDESGINRLKLNYFKKAAADHNIELNENLIIDTTLDADGGCKAMKKVLKITKPDVVFLASDSLALGAYRAIHEAGLSIPEDIGVMGCDNFYDSQFLVPSLSSIEIRRRELGELAAQHLMELIANNKVTVQDSLEPEVIHRESLSL